LEVTPVSPSATVSAPTLLAYLKFVLGDFQYIWRKISTF